MFEAHTKEMSHNDMTSKMSGKIMREWITAYDYQKTNPSLFLGGILNREVSKNPHFIKTIFYISHLYQTMETYNLSAVDPIARKEIIEWDEKGGLCVYLSVLTYLLLIQNQVANTGQLQYIQGYYRHDEREDMPFSIADQHIGMHAWLTFEEAVIDVAIAQEASVFDFNKTPIILGKVPEGMDLYGFIETKKTPRKYGMQIAKSSGMKFIDWLEYHNNKSLELILMNR